MKKLLAFTLLVVHLFNLTGYTLLFRYLGEQSSVQLSQQIEKNNYQDSELVEVKISLNLPYVSSWGDYERIDGEININGSHHNYVKRKVSGDTLYLLCLPNKEKDKLQASKSTFGTDANDLAGGSGKQQVKKAVTFSQYQIQDISYSFTHTTDAGCRAYPIVSSSLTDSFIDADGRPPRSLS